MPVVVRDALWSASARSPRSLRIRALSLRVDRGTPVSPDREVSCGVIGLSLGCDRCSRISRWFWFSAFATRRAIPAFPSSDIGGTLPSSPALAAQAF